MIYTVSLTSSVRDFAPNKTIQSTLPNILKNMLLDPDITQMDVVMLGPEDVQGPNAKLVNKALKKKHPDLCVIYTYVKPEDDVIKCHYSKQVRKLNASNLEDVFIDCVNEHKLNAGKQLLSSSNFKKLK